MTHKFFTTVSALIMAVTLSACGTTDTSQTTAAAAQPTQETATRKGDLIFNYSANAKTYRIHARYDWILRSYGTEIRVVSGAPLTGAPSEDAEVQNTIRDAFRAEGVCKDGKHPGILGVNYGYFEQLGAWAAQVRCSDTLQANI